MGLEGRQSEEAAMPAGGEHPPGARDGSAPGTEVAMDVAGTVASESLLLAEECLISVRSSWGVLR